MLSFNIHQHIFMLLYVTARANHAKQLNFYSRSELREELTIVGPCFGTLHHTNALLALIPLLT